MILLSRTLLLRPSTAASSSCSCSSLPITLRTFTSTPRVLARRKQEAIGKGADEVFPSVTGDLDKDGLTRYDLDLLETTDWVNSLLMRMQADGKAFVPKEDDTPSTPTPNPAFVFKYTDRHSYDLTQPRPTLDDSSVVLVAHIPSLALSPPQRHKLLLLAGKMYDPYTDTVTFTLGGKVDRSAVSFNEKKLALVRMATAFLDEAKKGDAFEDVPLDLRHVKPRKAHLAFPEEWKRPAAAAASSAKKDASEKKTPAVDAA
ncbi:28S ribosomal protein S35, mitochondrial [Phlyctochytrium bullatum]|nr:28S ribosomal protein S35, mitochondrial [Phlyctochytrium bullatum]